MRALFCSSIADRLRRFDAQQQLQSLLQPQLLLQLQPQFELLLPQPQQQIRIMMRISQMQELFSKHTENVHLTLLILNYPMLVENKWQLGPEKIFEPRKRYLER